MTGKRNETRTTDFKYPMVELLTGGIMSLMYLNTLAVCCLPLSSPWLFMQAWTKGLQNEHGSPFNRSSPRTGFCALVALSCS